MNTKTILYALLFLAISFTAISQKKLLFQIKFLKVYGYWISTNHSIPFPKNGQLKPAELATWAIFYLTEKDIWPCK
jgi:hypothetical protein